MGKLLIPFVAAFGLSLGIATGVVVVRAPKAPAVTAKAAPSKLDPSRTVQSKDDAAPAAFPLPSNVPTVPAAAAAAAAAAVAPGNAGTPVLLASAHAIPQNGEPAGTLVAAKNAPTSDEAKAAQAAAQTPVQDTVTGKRIAKVFGAMQARDAARVLEQMDDVDVRTILASLNNKQQAAILGTFPTQRAATIMRATLRNAGSDQ